MGKIKSCWTTNPEILKEISNIQSNAMARLYSLDELKKYNESVKKSRK
jgi:hypothetical protein